MKADLKIKFSSVEERKKSACSKQGLRDIWQSLMAEQRTDLPANEVKRHLVHFQISSQLLHWAAFQKMFQKKKNQGVSVTAIMAVAAVNQRQTLAFVSLHCSFHNCSV